MHRINTSEWELFYRLRFDTLITRKYGGNREIREIREKNTDAKKYELMLRSQQIRVLKAPV